MKNRALRARRLSALLLPLLLASPAAAEKGPGVYKGLDILCDVVTIIQRDYIEKLSSERLMQDALRGMLNSLDSYSTYMPAASVRGPRPSPDKGAGTYGLEVAYKDKLLTVVAPVEGGPAWKAGVKSGDLIIKIDKEPVDDRPLAELIQLFRGETTRRLELQVARRGEREFLDFTLLPGKIEGAPARVEMLEEKIALMRISRFDTETPARAADLIAKLNREGGDGMVLDLRDCPAGEIGSALAIAEHFIPSGGLLATLSGRTKEAAREFRSGGKAPHVVGPVVVLVNAGTSGAAEVIAGALQDGGRGVLMGQRSFGCAFEEGSFTLKDGSVITMLTAVYRTPDGSEIQDEGLDPDVEVPLPAVAPGEAGAEEEEIALAEDGVERDLRGVKGVKVEKGVKDEGGLDPMTQRAVDLIKGIHILEHKERS